MTNKTRRRPPANNQRAERTGPRGPVPPSPATVPARGASAEVFDQHAAPVPDAVPVVPSAVPDPVPSAAGAVPALDRVAARLARRDTESEAEARERRRQLLLDAAEDKARLATEERHRAAELAKLAADAEAERITLERQARTAEHKRAASEKRWQALGKRVRHAVVANTLRARRLTLNLGVSGAAVYGQHEFLASKTKIGNPGTLLVAVLLELLAVSVMDHANRARRAGRRCWHLYVMAAGIAAGVAGMNVMHWQGKDLLLVGATFGAFSLAAPLLWTLDAIEGEADRAGTSGTARAARPARFPASQWMLWTRDTWAAKRLAVRHTITDPSTAFELAVERRDERHAARAEARAAGRHWYGKRRQPLAPVPVEVPTEAPAPPVEVPAAATVPPLDAPVPVLPPVPPAPPLDPPAPPYRLEGVPSAAHLASMSTQDKQAAARATARKAIKAGYAITDLELGQAYGFGDRWGRYRLSEIRTVAAAG